VNYRTFSVVGISGILLAIGSISVLAYAAVWRIETTDGFSFKYPTTWDLEERENRINSISATLDYDRGGNYGQILFEHYDPDLSESIQSSENVVQNMETVLTNVYDGARIYETATDKYVINNQSAPYVLAKFSRSTLLGIEHDYVVMAIVINLGANDVIFAQYISAENDFNKLLGTAEQIFHSVKSVGAVETLI